MDKSATLLVWEIETQRIRHRLGEDRRRRTIILRAVASATVAQGFDLEAAGFDILAPHVDGAQGEAEHGCAPGDGLEGPRVGAGDHQEGHKRVAVNELGACVCRGERNVVFSKIYGVTPT